MSTSALSDKLRLQPSAEGEADNPARERPQLGTTQPKAKEETMQPEAKEEPMARVEGPNRTVEWSRGEPTRDTRGTIQ